MNTLLKLKPLTVALLTITLTTSLTACGGSDGNENAKKKNEQSKSEIDKKATKQSLVKAGSTEGFANYYKDAMNARPKITTTTDKDTPINRHSTTNLIETGVDELDYVKQNSSHIFVTKVNDTNSAILNVFSKPNTQPIANLPLKAISLSGLFLNKDNLYALKQMSYGDYYTTNGQSNYKNGKVELDTISISNPSQPNVSKTYSWEGNLKESRRIGDSIYAISHSQLNEHWNCIIPTSTATNSVNSNLQNTPCYQPTHLKPEDIAENMPIDINGNKVDPADCYIPGQYNKNSTNLSNVITLITRVDLSGNEHHNTTCIAASADHFYMSKNALYLASWDYDNDKENYKQRTIINKFKLTDSSEPRITLDAPSPVLYSGTGVVDGHINWDSGNFSMNEHKDILRVVTNKTDSTDIVNMVHTLKESDTELKLENLATIPNSINTKRIGKPNETIKGIRFMGDEGYVVTFKQTDPLYKLDLSKPTDPKIMGELEMPGYSAYLHKLNESYLLGIGYTADTDSGRQTGIQVTVFDTTGDSPTIVSQKSLNIDNDSTAQSWFNLAVAKDSRAITTLIEGNQMRLSIPYTIETYGNSSDSKDKTISKALEYDIDLTNGLLSNEINRENVTLNSLYMRDIFRSLMDHDDIYYSSNDGSLKKYVWGVQ